jgi:hypothetical protein
MTINLNVEMVCSEWRSFGGYPFRGITREPSRGKLQSSKELDIVCVEDDNNVGG